MKTITDIRQDHARLAYKILSCFIEDDNMPLGKWHQLYSDVVAIISALESNDQVIDQNQQNSDKEKVEKKNLSGSSKTELPDSMLLQLRLYRSFLTQLFIQQGLFIWLMSHNVHQQSLMERPEVLFSQIKKTLLDLVSEYKGHQQHKTLAQNLVETLEYFLSNRSGISKYDYIWCITSYEFWKSIELILLNSDSNEIVVPRKFEVPPMFSPEPHSIIPDKGEPKHRDAKR